MKNYRLLFLLLVLFTLGAFAVSDKRVDLYNSPMPAWFQAGLYIGEVRANSPQDTLNKITSTCAGQVSFDFDAGQAGDFRWSPIAVCNGAKLNDICEVNSDLSVIVNSNRTDRQGCRVIQDGGIAVFNITGTTNNDLPDAGFNFRVWSNH